mgnify:FL=1
MAAKTEIRSYICIVDKLKDTDKLELLTTKNYYNYASII